CRRGVSALEIAVHEPGDVCAAAQARLLRRPVQLAKTLHVQGDEDLGHAREDIWHTIQRGPRAAGATHRSEKRGSTGWLAGLARCRRRACPGRPCACVDCCRGVAHVSGFFMASAHFLYLLRLPRNASSTASSLRWARKPPVRS